MVDTSLLIFAAIAVLLLLSAFFSGAETALTAASRARMHELAKQGNARARMINALRQRQERLIGGILLGNNLVNILASSLATSLAIAYFGDAGVAVATVAMTLLVLIFAEILPKTYAIRHPDGIALRVAPTVRIAIAGLSPVSRLLQRVVQVLLILIRTERPTPHSVKALEEELRGAIDLHAHSGAEAAEEGVMLRNILDLADVEVGEIMTHRKNIELIDVDLPQEEIFKHVLDSPYSRIPLYKNEPDNIVGVIHAKELLRASHERKGDVSALDIGANAALPWFIPESTGLLTQLRAFRRRREHFALVVDEYGSLMGIVTLEDVLEEIVGEIDDEFDVPVAGVRPQGDGSYIVDGLVTIRDLNRQFGWNLPDEEATTIAGLVLHEARTIPEEGQSFAFHGFRFDVLRRSGNQITSLKIAPRRHGGRT